MAMKIIVTLVLSLFVSLSHADFISAQIDYSKGDFEKAYKEYLILAKYGNNKAQYNLAVMFVKGQGVDIDLTQAYAWSKVSESNPEYKALTNVITKKLSKQQLKQAEKLYQQFFTHYSFNNSKILLGPIVESQTSEQAAEIVIEQTFAPSYPRAMAKEHIQGWVDLSFRIYPDGSVRDIFIAEEVPPNSFAKEAIKSIEKFRFSFKKNGHKVSIDEPRFATQRIEFRLEGYGTGINPAQQEYLDNLITKANAGDIDAQYSYAFLYDTYLNQKGEIDGEKINQWLFNASIDGITGAQYRLGQNIYSGSFCKVEKQKGLDWMMRATQTGNASAQFMVYNMLENNNLVNKSQQPAIYWLEQAASNGSVIAQLIYAKKIASEQSPNQQQLNLASHYLSNYSDNVYKTIQWYQVNALVLSKKNKKSKALSNINKAIKLAKKAHWDLTELKQQKLTIKNNK